jgi:hypothetical protein
MRATYQIADTSVETTDEPHPKTRAREVEKAFSELLDVEVNLVSQMSPPAHIDLYGQSDVGITLEMSDWANETVRNGFGFFSLDRNLNDYFGESEGSSNVTGQVLEKNLSVDQVIAILGENGDLQKAVNEIHNNRAEDDPDTMTILAYTFLKYSLGWDAERILSESGDFKKGNTAQDKGGIDGWWMSEKRQIKPGTEVPSKGRRKLMAKDVTHAAYLWDMDGGLRVADLDEYRAMKGELADEAGLPKTLIDRSDDLSKNEMNRRFRFFWW